MALAETAKAKENVVADRLIVNAPSLPKGDYVSPGLKVVLPDAAFPSMIVGATERSEWPYLRSEIGHNWYVDRRNPTVGFLSRDEALLLYNLALGFEGLPCIEIGCWRGWSTVHLSLGSGNLDVVDPILANPDFLEDVTETLRRAGVLGRVSLHAGSSPEEVERIAATTRKRWSFAFIDGNHEGYAPRLDAEVVHRNASDDAMIVIHDVVSNEVAAALFWLREQGWDVYVYQTMQIMGVAVRGSVKPIAHIPDPAQHWTLPPHLYSVAIIGETRGARLRRVAAGICSRPFVPASSFGSTLDSLQAEDAAALDVLLANAAPRPQQNDLTDLFEQLQHKYLDQLKRCCELESTRDGLIKEHEDARRVAVAAASDRQDAIRELRSLTLSFDRLQRNYVGLLHKAGALELERDAVTQQIEGITAERDSLRQGQQVTHDILSAAAEEKNLRRAFRGFAFWIARERVLFGLTRRLLLGRTKQVRDIIEQMLHSHGVPDHLIPAAMWFAHPRVVFGLARRRAFTDMLSVQGHVAIALERMFGIAPDICAEKGSISVDAPAVTENQTDLGRLREEVRDLREQIAVAQRRFVALEEAKLDDEKALLEADLEIARLRGAGAASPGEC